MFGSKRSGVWSSRSTRRSSMPPAGHWGPRSSCLGTRTFPLTTSELARARNRRACSYAASKAILVSCRGSSPRRRCASRSGGSSVAHWTSVADSDHLLVEVGESFGPPLGREHHPVLHGVVLVSSRYGTAPGALARRYVQADAQAALDGGPVVQPIKSSGLGVPTVPPASTLFRSLRAGAPGGRRTRRPAR